MKLTMVTINYVGEGASKALYKRCKRRYDELMDINTTILSQLNTIEAEAANVQPIEDAEIIAIVTEGEQPINTIKYV